MVSEEQYIPVLLLPDIKVPLSGFTEELMYEKGKTPRYNGNISSRIFSEGRYDYTYDPYNRLISASYTDTSNKDRKYSATYFYDSTSKITSLLRTGIIDRVGTTDVYGQHSDIYYSYTGSRLTSLGSGAAGTDYEGRTGLPVDGTWALGYDANGNLSYDESHNITSVSYNHLNQPTEICFADGSRIENSYASDGRKWQATYVLPDSSRSVTKYLGNAIVRDGKFDMMRTPWGYFDGNSRPHYYVTDYQGNITHTVNESAEIEQTVSYYPDGEPWIEPTGKNPYLYGGKERISFAGLRQYDFGARMLNTSAGGHWWQVDPKCEENMHINPYVYCNGNTVMLVDPNGEKPSPYEAALMSEYAYILDAKSKEGAKILDKLQKQGWIRSEFPTTISKENSSIFQDGLGSELFERTIDGVTEYAYAYAGSQSPEDFVEDVLQLFGLAPQYGSAINNACVLSSELSDAELTFVGHSLGGGEAAAASMATGRNAITFNPASLSRRTRLRYSLSNSDKIENFIAAPPGNSIIGGCCVNNFQNNVGMPAPGKHIRIPIPTRNAFDAHRLKHMIKHFSPFSNE